MQTQNRSAELTETPPLHNYHLCIIPTFAAQQHTARRRQPEIVRLEPNNFADSGTAVEHQAQEREITAAILTVHFHRFQHRLDFVGVKMLDLPGPGALEGDAQYALDLRQVLRPMSAQIPKEAMDGTQADIAGADAIVPTCFETRQERGEPFDSKFFNSELAGIAFLARREL
jgi:hypothetical protein